MSNLPRWARVLTFVVPGDIRREFTANLAADHREMRARGVSALVRSLLLCRGLLGGFAQYAPLRPVVTATSPRPRVAERAALGGALAWRVAGPALFIGHLLSSTLLLVLGAVAFVAAFGCLVAVAATASNPLPARQQRFIAAILGGTVATLLLTVVFSVLTLGVLALASFFSSGLLMALAVKALVLVATFSLALVAGSGWVPEEFTPKRIVEVRPVRRREPDEVAAAR